MRNFRQQHFFFTQKNKTMSLEISADICKKLKEFEEFKEMSDEDTHHFLDSMAKEVAQTYVHFDRMVLWEVPHRFGLHILSKNNVLSVKLMEKAIADLEKCEREYDILEDLDRKTYRTIQAHLFHALITRRQDEFNEHCSHLRTNTNLQIVKEVLNLLTKPSTCTQEFKDSIAKELWNTMEKNFKPDFVRKRMSRVSKIIEALDKKE